MPSHKSLLIVCSVICLIGIGCSKNHHVFLGVPENETSGQGPVGLINGETIQVDDVSIVREVSYVDYMEAKQAERIVAEEYHDDHVYWAVEEERDIPFEGATAWTTVLERFKAKIPTPR